MSLSPTRRLLPDNEPEQYGTFMQPGDPNDEITDDVERRSKKVEEQLLRKLDFRCAFLMLIFVVNYIDRTNAAAARLKGLERDLQMSGTQFNTLIGILYFGYSLVQTPSNWFLHRIQRPSIYLSGGMSLWGVISIATGASQSFYSALVLRFLLGFAEAAFLPGAIFLLSRWYTRSELGLRMAILSCGGSVSNAFGSLIASGILSGMDDALGIPGWRWLFFIEGSLTLVISVFAVFIIPDFPTSPANWLTSEEHLFAQLRMEQDRYGLERAQANEKEYALWDSLSDWKIWWLGVTLAGVLSTFSFSLFFPTLCETMGYNPTITLLLCAPPWVIAIAISFLVTRHSDSSGERFWHVTGPIMVCVIGFVIAISTMNTTIRYASFFLMTQVATAYVMLMTWISNSIPEPSKRAVGIGIINTIGTCGMAGASYLWPSYWGPTYVNSFAICIALSFLSIAMCWVYRAHLSRLNVEAETNERTSGLCKGFRYLL